MAHDDAKYQISGKVGDPQEGIIYLARGDDPITTVAEFVDLREQLRDQLGAGNPVPAAVQNVRESFPSAQIVSQTAANNCVHGPMTYKSGNGAKGPWGGYFCTKGRNSGCEVIWDKK